MFSLSQETLSKLREEFPPEYSEAQESEMLPVADVDWSGFSHKELTCKNHPLARYLSKNPFERGLHFIQGPNGLSSLFEKECDCPFDDLRVVIQEN